MPWAIVAPPSLTASCSGSDTRNGNSPSRTAKPLTRRSLRMGSKSQLIVPGLACVHRGQPRAAEVPRLEPNGWGTSRAPLPCRPSSLRSALWASLGMLSTSVPALDRPARMGAVIGNGAQPNKPLEEGAQPPDDALLLLAVAASSSEARGGWQNLGDLSAGGAHLAVTKRGLDEDSGPLQGQESSATATGAASLSQRSSRSARSSGCVRRLSGSRNRA